MVHAAPSSALRGMCLTCWQAQPLTQISIKQIFPLGRGLHYRAATRPCPQLLRALQAR